MTLIDSSEDAHTKREVFLVSRKENESQVVEKHFSSTLYKQTGERSEYTHTVKQQKFLCVNGPNAGKGMTEEEGGKIGYVRFNCGQSGRRWAKNSQIPKCVLVHF